jgi:hypothetical protein
MSATPHNTFSPPPPEPAARPHNIFAPPPPEPPRPLPRPDDVLPANIEEDRRRAARLKQKFVTQMTPWEPGHASVPFEVVIADLSDVGVGIIHDQPLAIGLRHLLTVPRGTNGKTVVLEYLVARCEVRHDGSYLVGLQRADARPPAPVAPKRRVSEQVKLLFLLFGIFGLIIAFFAPL